jgi:hypothetical protein
MTVLAYEGAPTDEVTMVVRRLVPRPRHGGVYCAGPPGGEAERGRGHPPRARHFRCVCGEPLLDDDPCFVELSGVGVHENCAELLGMGAS